MPPNSTRRRKCAVTFRISFLCCIGFRVFSRLPLRLEGKRSIQLLRVTSSRHARGHFYLFLTRRTDSASQRGRRRKYACSAARSPQMAADASSVRAMYREKAVHVVNLEQQSRHALCYSGISRTDRRFHRAFLYLATRVSGRLGITPYLLQRAFSGKEDASIKCLRR